MRRKGKRCIAKLDIIGHCEGQMKSIDHRRVTSLTLLIGVISWLLYIKLNESWFSSVGQVMGWFLRPEFYGVLTPPSIPLVPSFALPLISSGLLVYHLLRGVKISITDKIALTVALFLSLAGWFTIIFGVLKILYSLYINIAFLSIILCLAFLSLRRRGPLKIRSFLSMLKPLTTMRYHRPLFTAHVILFALLLGVVSFFYFYHALMYPVDGWDELIYHATMSKIIFTYRGFPIMVGPSVGIEMSSNYPPLFSAIAAYFYVQINAIDDVFIKIISPISAILAIYVTYKLGELLGGSLIGLLSSLFIAITPLFINHAFYANCYMLQTSLFLFALYFAHLYFDLRRGGLLIISGLLTGFALATGYNAIPLSLVLTAFIILRMRGHLKEVIKYVVPLMAIGFPWYFRNLLVVGDPIFPFLTSLLHLPLTDLNLLTITLRNIKEVSFWTAFGKTSPQPLDFLYVFAFHRGLFPSLSLLTFAGIIQGMLTERKLRSYAWLTLTALALIMVTSGFFIRYLLPVLPLFAILTANSFASIIHDTREGDRKLLMALSILVIIPMILVQGLPALIGGRSFIPHSPQLSPPSDFLFLFKRPGMNWYEALRYEYGDDVDAWAYLDAHLKEGEKVLTMEQRIYYIKNGDPKFFVFLDSDKVKPLHRISSPKEIIGWLKEQNISYIYLSQYPVPQHISQMPLIKLLGSPYFPIVYWKPNPSHCIYKVGPITTPITRQEGIYVNVNQWAGPIYIENKTALGVKAGDYLAPRVYVTAPSPMLVRMTYLDVGKGCLDVNLLSPTTGKWYLGLSIIRKEGSGLWKEYSFIVPPDPLGFIELGLHAYEDFWISNLTIEPVNVTGYCHIGRLDSMFRNSTQPPTIMVLLPPLVGNEVVQVEAKSQYSISVEIFEGVIQPWETTKWWERHRMVVRSPELPTFGIRSPTLYWRAKPGIYTLVVVLWDEYKSDAKAELSITISIPR